MKDRTQNKYKYEQVGDYPEVQGWFKIGISTNFIQHINRIKEKNYVIDL